MSAVVAILMPLVDPQTVVPSLDADSAAVFVAAGIAAFVAAWRKPSAGLIALLVLEVLDYTHKVGTTTVTSGKVAVIAVAIALAMRCGAGVLRDRRARGLLLALAALFLTTVCSAWLAHDRFVVVREALKIVDYALVFAVALVGMHADPDRRWFEIGVWATALIVCASALPQAFFGAPSGFWVGATPVPRIAGVLEGPNQLAGYLGLFLPFFVVRAIDRSIVARLALLALVVTLVLTYSRAGLLGATVATMVVLQQRVSPRFTLARLGAVVAVVVAAAAVALQTRIAPRFFAASDTQRPDGLGTRSELWHAALVLFGRSPVTGIGAGNFQSEIGITENSAIHTHANSWYFQSLAEGGILMFAATLFTLYHAIVTFVRDAPRDRLILAVVAGTAGLFAHQIFDLLVYYPKIGTTWWLLLGAATALVVAKRDDTESDAVSPSR